MHKAVEHIKPTQISGKFSRFKHGWRELYVTILFSEGTFFSRLGRFNYGFSREVVRFYLEDAICPVECRILIENLSTRTTGIKSSGNKETSSKALKSSVSVKAQASPELASTLSGEQSASHEKNGNIEWEFSIPTVTARGGETRPEWLFEISPPERVLRGGLREVKFAEIKIRKDYRATIKVFAEQRDLILLDAEDTLIGKISVGSHWLARARLKRDLGMLKNGFISITEVNCADVR